MTVATMLANASSQMPPTRKNIANAAANPIPETTRIRAMTIPSGICLTAAGSSSDSPDGVVSSCI